MAKINLETKESWIIFEEVLGYNKIPQEELAKIDPDF